MMDYSGIVNTDNLYKFLSTTGALMLLFAIIYPMEKKHVLELEVNEIRKDSTMLAEDMRIARDTINKKRELYKERTKAFNKLSDKKKFLESQYSNLATEIDRKILGFEKTGIEIEYKIRRAVILQKQIDEFLLWKRLLCIFGTIFLLFGISKWYKNQKMMDNKIEQ